MSTWKRVECVKKAKVFVHHRAADADTLSRLMRESTEQLKNLWQPTFVNLYGKSYEERRRVLGFGDDNIEYEYSGRTVKHHKWTEAPVLLEIRKLVTELCHTHEDYKELPEPNFCLVNLYRNGDDKIGAHSDDESSLQRGMPIVSLSLGDARRFVFHERKGKQVGDVMLRHGTCLIMGDSSQTLYKHSVPEMKNHDLPRISFTFRYTNTKPSHECKTE